MTQDTKKIQQITFDTIKQHQTKTCTHPFAYKIAKKRLGINMEVLFQ